MGDSPCIKILQRWLQRASYDQFFGLEPEGKQQAEQNESSQTTSPALNREPPTGIIQVYWPGYSTETTPDGKS
jgi:hypothetical protein